MTSPSALQAFLDTSPDPVPPPPGIEANFNAPNTNGTAYIIIAVIGIFLATVFTVVRVYTKGILTRSLGWDDCKRHFLFCCLCSPPKEESQGEAGQGRGGWVRWEDVINLWENECLKDGC